MTQSFSSGSTIFGDDTADDTHQFTGSLLQSGNSLVIEGDYDPIVRVKVLRVLYEDFFKYQCGCKNW